MKYKVIFTGFLFQFLIFFLHAAFETKGYSPESYYEYALRENLHTLQCNLKQAHNRFYNKFIVAVIEYISIFKAIPTDIDNLLEKYRLEIEEICFSNCFWLTDEGLMAFAECSLPKLKRAFFQNCFQLTDKSIRFFSKRCQNLEVLSIAGCYHVSDKSIEALSENCIQLKHLDLTGCFGLSSFSKLKNLCIACKHMSDLRVNGTLYDLQELLEQILFADRDT